MKNAQKYYMYFKYQLLITHYRKISVYLTLHMLNIQFATVETSIHTHTHTHPFNGPFSGTTWLSRYQKGKPIWILLKQETVSGSGIS